MTRLLPALTAAFLLTSCRAAILPGGATLDAAKRNADNAFAAFAFRFHNVQRDPAFAATRTKMARHALVPSRIFDDTSAWTVRDAQPRTRATYLQAAHADGRYHFAMRPTAPYPTRLGEQRHYIQLRDLGEDSYEWLTTVEHAIGPVRASQVGNAIGALFTAFEGRRGPELLAESRALFPATARHLGQLLRIDSLHSTPLADGTTTFALFVRYDTTPLQTRYPFFTQYVNKYITPTNYRIQLSDRRGGQFADIRQRDEEVVVRLRARNGSLVPLSGPPRPIPDSLLITMDVSAKFRIFRVGFTRLVGDFTIERGERDQAWMMRFRREPEWHFPLAADKLIKTPLRRPFAGRGSEVRIGVRDDLGNQAMVVRQMRMAVRESAIMRWLGGLGSTAFGDFEGRTEIEENRFLQELFGALRQDVAHMR